MDKQQTIYILSDNRDFIEPFCALVTRELGLSCTELQSKESLPDCGAALIISDKALESAGIPAITVNLPIRVNRLLTEIEGRLSDGALAGNELADIGNGLQLSLKNKLVRHKTSDVEAILTDKESQLLYIIAQAGNPGVSRELLLKEVWGIDSALDTHTLETHIYRLRKKLRDIFAVEMIKAFEGGYRL